MNRLSFTLCLICLVMASACSTSTSAPQPPSPATQELFTLRLVSVPEEGGYILPDEGDYAANLKLILNAIPSKGFVFESWSGDVSGSGNSLELTMDSDKLAVANFSQLATATPRPTATPKPTPTATPEPCRKPAGISSEDAGQMLEVCGEVTNWGMVPCPTCARGGYSFLKMDGAFLIISYDWVFNDGWIGNCILVVDTVEMLGAAPVFVFGGGEGFAGSECTTLADGSRSCSSGDYFQAWLGCDAD